MARDESQDLLVDGSPTSPSSRPLGHRLALIATVALLVFVGVALPLAVRSMAVTLFGRQEAILYDLVAGGVVPPVVTVPPRPDQSFVNIAVVALDPVMGVATLAVSGNRVCSAACPTVTLTMFSLDDNAAQRRGLPPSATLMIAPDDLLFSQAIDLPVRGRPNLYPFDTYELWLGFSVVATRPDGQPINLQRAVVEEGVVVTLQSQLSHLVMDPPRAIDPNQASSITDPYDLPLVEALYFQRPDYLKILTVLLVTLITVSGSIALFRRDVDDLLLGIGGLILGVWGIRSVLVSQPLPGVSAIDLALSFVILFLLLGLTLRLTRYFHRGSNWRWPRRASDQLGMTPIRAPNDRDAQSDPVDIDHPDTADVNSGRHLG